MLATIDYYGVPLVCEFSYYAGYAGSYIEPPEPETAEFSSIKVGAVEVYPMFTDDQLGEIEEVCLQWMRDRREAALEARRDRERDECE